MAERAGSERSRFERVLFSFMGPPQLGDPSAPAVEAPPGPVAVCTKCDEPYDRHQIVRAPRLTYTRCPERAQRPDGDSWT